MAISYICDGTGLPVEKKDMVEMGYVIKRQYSPEATIIAMEYQAEIDALHDLVAKKFQVGLAKIRSTYLKKLDKLPDVQDAAQAAG